MNNNETAAARVAIDRDTEGGSPAGRWPDAADVAHRAYALYCARDCQHGHDLGDWLEAERQLLGESERSGPTPAATTAAD